MDSANAPIAVVDDERPVREALETLLRSAGLRAKTFGSGTEFLAGLADWVPACVILDLHMPGTSGFDVQARLNEMKVRIPVIVITGYDSPEAYERACSAGAAVYLRKPVDGSELLDAISAAVGRGAVDQSPKPT
jgi:FixJ family two-component response regulator